MTQHAVESEALYRGARGVRGVAWLFAVGLEVRA